MAQADKIKWNSRYGKDNTVQNPSKIVVDFAHYACGKIALDIACGLGRHSRYLAKNNFYIDALDISDTAIQTLQNIPYVDAKVVDFDTYKFLENHYDLVICTYFLERSLFPKILKALKQNGIFIFETFIHHPHNEQAPKNTSFLLQYEELENTFSTDYHIVHLEKWWDVDTKGFKTMKGSIVLRKI